MINPDKEMVEKHIITLEAENGKVKIIMSDENMLLPPFLYQQLQWAFIIRSSRGLPSILHTYNDKTLSNNKVIGQKVHDQSPGVNYNNRFFWPWCQPCPLKTGVNYTRFPYPSNFKNHIFETVRDFVMRFGSHADWTLYFIQRKTDNLSVAKR